MMKKSVLYLLLLSASLGACENKDESIFEKTTDERLREALDAYEAQLSEAMYGWNAVVYPGNGSSYGFYMKFDGKNRVKMYSDFSSESATTPKESSYRLKAMQTPTLIFDTYGYLHLLADPDGEVNGGNDGEGLVSDFEFAIYPDSVTADKIVFVGRKNQSKLVLTRATQPEATAYGNGDLAKALMFNNVKNYATYFKRVTIGGVTYEMTVDLTTRTLKLTWLEGVTAKSFTTNYHYSSTGVTFSTPLVNGSQTINGFDNPTWDAAKLTLSFSVESNTVSVVGAARPMSIDLNAPRRWRQFVLDKGSYWISQTGFTVAGQKDFFGITNIPDFQYMLYFPAIASSQGISYDAFTAYDETNLMGPAVVPTFTTDGRVTFSVLGIYGTNALMNTTVLDLVEDASGYYLVQTSDLTYDMVSAKDGKTWITWWYPF